MKHLHALTSLCGLMAACACFVFKLQSLPQPLHLQKPKESSTQEASEAFWDKKMRVWCCYIRPCVRGATQVNCPIFLFFSCRLETSTCLESWFTAYIHTHITQTEVTQIMFEKMISCKFNQGINTWRWTGRWHKNTDVHASMICFLS